MGRRRASLGDGKPFVSRGGPYRSSSVPRGIPTTTTTTINNNNYNPPLVSSTTNNATGSGVRNRYNIAQKTSEPYRSAYLQPINRNSLSQEASMRIGRQSSKFI